MKLSLRNRFLLPTLLLIVLGMGLAAVVSVYNARQALKGVVIDQMRQTSHFTTIQIGAWIHDRQREMRSLARDPLFRTACGEGAETAQNVVSSQFTTMQKDYPVYEVLNLVSKDGEIVACSDRSLIGKLKLTDREYFRTAIKGQEAISDVLKSKASGKPVIAVAAPVRIGEAVVGAVVGVIDLSYFTRDFVDTVKVGQTGYAYVMNAKGLVVAHPDAKKIMELDLSKHDFGKRILADKKGVAYYTFEGVAKLAAFEEEAGLKWIVVVTANLEELMAPATSLGYINLVIALAVILAAALVIFLVAASIVRPINRHTSELSGAAAQVAAASGEVASTSQTLAQGTSEQAASLEESSSSLEELASMTRQNADNANQAKGLMDETSRVVSQANRSMKDLRQAMDRINQASDQTAKIIKTIDEIAFQTNLLALNAAVEAARAGEAGAGFAVVAGEVRNLAMRAAEAAKSTSELIEGNIQNIRGGSELVKVTDEAFDRVEASSRKVDELIGEIAAASSEQSHGIDQLNQGVTQMDKVTQQNAAGAEESASAAEELSSQAATMQGVVAELAALVGAGGAEAGPRRSGGPARAGQQGGMLRLLPWRRGRQTQEEGDLDF